MSTQQFLTREREAFWKVYGKKCFYHCGELLLEEMELDHVIPEDWLSLVESVRAQKLMELGLPSTFDISAYENIVASCGACNGKKGTLVPYVGQLHITLARAKENAPKVRFQISRRKYAASKEQLLIAVVAAIEAGNVSGHEIVDHLKANGYLGFITGSTSTMQLSNQRFIQFATMRPVSDMLKLEITAEDLVLLIDSDDTKVVREQTVDGRVRVEIRNGDMYIKYEVRGNEIWVFSAHLVS